MSNLAPLCPPCVEKRMRWLDAKMPTLGIQLVSHSAYDRTVAGLLDNRRARVRQWYALVREQMAGIAANCRAAGHTAAPGTPAIPRAVRLDLLTQGEK